VLRAMLGGSPLEPELRPAFVQAASSLRSSLEQNRVLADYVRAERP